LVSTNNRRSRGSRTCNAAIRIDLTLASFGNDTANVQANLSVLADRIADTVRFGFGRKVFVEERGLPGPGAHVGSREFGPTVASAFPALSHGASWGDHMPEREVLLNVNESLGHDY